MSWYASTAADHTHACPGPGPTHKMQEWLDTGRVLVATKCNQLMELDVQSGQQRSVELPPEPPQRPHPTVDSGGRAGGNRWIHKWVGGQVALQGWMDGQVAMHRPGGSHAQQQAQPDAGCAVRAGRSGACVLP